MNTQHETHHIHEEPIDLESYAKESKPPPKGKKEYRIRIDDVKKTVTKESMKGREILDLVGKKPETHILYQKLHKRGTQVVGADEVVDFTTPGVERFQTLARDNTEG